MRILFLSIWFPYPADNGYKLRVHHLLRALNEKHDVDLVSFLFPPAAAARTGELPDFYRRATVVKRDPFERGAALRSLRFLSPAPIVSYPIKAMQDAVKRTLAGSAYDVVIASTYVMGRYGLLAAPGITQVMEEHNSLGRWMWERYRNAPSTVQRLRCWLSWQKTRAYEAALFSRFDLCTMVSEQDCDYTRRLLPGYRGPVRLVPNGVDCEHNRPAPDKAQTNTLVFSGSLTYDANYDAMAYFLADVWPLVRQQIPDAVLTITGSTEGVDLARLKLDDHVKLVGWVKDVRPAVAGAGLCVAPIRQGGGTRLKILEAMALGTPVIATSKGAEGLHVTDGKDIALADRPSVFADRVVRLLRDPAQYSLQARNARSLVEELYDWTCIGRSFVGMIEEARAGRPAQSERM